MKPKNPSPIADEYLQRGRSSVCPIIDMHGHVGPYHSVYLPSARLDRMLISLQRCGVQKIVCSHHVALAYDVERGNAMMQQVIDRHPDHFLGYWVVNPNYPDIVEKDLITFEQGRGFVGFKLWPDYHFVPLSSPKYASVLNYANEHELLVLVHTWGESPYDPPSLLGEVAVNYPRARFLMAHCGYGDWETAVSIGGELPNVYLDLAAVVLGIDFALMPGGSLMRTSLGSPQVNGLIEYMVKTAGPKKVVFGSDLPWWSPHAHVGGVLFSRISDEARHDILHRNAERLLGEHLHSGSKPGPRSGSKGR